MNCDVDEVTESLEDEQIGLEGKFRKEKIFEHKLVTINIVQNQNTVGPN